MPIIEKRCLRCQATFTCWRRPLREKQYCGRTCADTAHGERMRRPVKAARPTATSRCQWCSATFTHPRSKHRTYCGKRCAMLARLATTDLLARVAARARSKTPTQRAAASARMRRLNADPTIRAKAAAAKRGRTFPGPRGGNGSLTPQQELLHTALGWCVEYCIPTGHRSWPCARVDLAEPTLKVALELDGWSHHGLKQRNRDARKVAMLTALGWRVLRFWNSEVERNLISVVATIRAVERAGSLPLSS